MVAVDSPVGGENADDVEPMVPLGVTGNWGPRAAVVLDLDPNVVARTDNDSGGERSTLQAGVAMAGSVGGEFGCAEDHVVCNGAVGE